MEQRVHQRRLAHVGPAGQHDARALADQPRGAGIAPAVELGDDLAQTLRHLGRGGLFLHLVGKIVAGLDERQQRENAVGNFAHEARHAALHLAHGRPGGGLGVRADELHDGLGAAQVDAAVEERTLGELAGIGRACAQLQRAIEHAARGHVAAVALNLGHVLPGIGLRLGHPHGHGLVQRLAARVDGAAVHHPPRLEGALGAGGAKARAKNPACVAAAEPNDGDSARAPRRGDGRNGIGGHGWSSFREGNLLSVFLQCAI